MSVKHVHTEAEYYSAKANEGLVIVDFSAEWCGPCKMVAPKFEEFAQEHPEITCIHVDVDELENLKDGNDVRGVPTFKYFKNSELLEQFSGANIDKIKETAEKHSS